MKKLIAAMCAFGLAGALALAAEMETSTTTTTTTTGAGTVAAFTPGEFLSVRTETGTEPVRYKMADTVTYVTTTGEEIPATQVAVGTPVTVHYKTVGTDMVVDRVVVEKTATTTTTTE
jgi:hypothetical protein